MPMVMAPGRSRASAASSRAELTCMAAFTTSMVELNTAMPTGAKSLQRIVRQIAAQRGIDRDRSDRREEERVAVGLRLGHVLGRDRAVGARPVLDDDALSERRPEPIGQ